MYCLIELKIVRGINNTARMYALKNGPCASRRKTKDSEGQRSLEYSMNQRYNLITVTVSSNK